MWLAGLFGGVVVVATLVNWFAREHRRRLRRVVVLFVLCGIASAAAFAASHFELTWGHGPEVAADLLAALTIANASGMLLFFVVLPLIAIKLPMIAGDLVVGLGYIVATVVVLSRHGLDPTSAFATGAVVSAVLAISLQTTLGNILGGVALQLDGSIHEGDLIRLADGTTGRIEAIRWRHTLIDTRASTVIVPNAQLLANNITILGWRDQAPFRQPAAVAFGVDLAVSPGRVTRIINDAIGVSPIDNVATEPKPTCACAELLATEGYAKYSLGYVVIDRDRAEDTASRMRGRIYAALRRAQIPLATAGRVPLADRGDRDAGPGKLPDRLAVLHTIHLFQSLTADELGHLADGMMFVPFAAGETILRQGAAAHSLFVVTVGTAEVRARLDIDGTGPQPERTEVVATITAPDFFGEMGLLTGEPRRADVVAKTDVECYRLPQAAFEHVLLGRPEIVNELSERLASRNVGLTSVREHLDEAARISRHAAETERIRDGIRDFFGL